MKKLTALLITLLLLVSLTTGQTKLGGTAKLGGTVKSGTAAAGGSSLDTGLVAFWKLGEAAGNTRADSSPNGHTLSESAATVGSGTGQIGNAAVFIQSNFLRIADNASLSLTGNATIVYWASINSSISVDFPAFVSKWAHTDQRSYSASYNRPAARFNFSVSSTGTGETAGIAANTFGAPTLGSTFYFVTNIVDVDNDIVGISVNNGTLDTAAFTATVFDGTADLEIGRLATADNTLHGIIDAVGIWNRRLTTTELTCLYNGGTGVEPPFAACP